MAKKWLLNETFSVPAQTIDFKNISFNFNYYDGTNIVAKSNGREILHNVGEDAGGTRQYANVLYGDIDFEQEEYTDVNFYTDGSWMSMSIELEDPISWEGLTADQQAQLRTIEFANEPSGDLLTWLEANATSVATQPITTTLSHVSASASNPTTALENGTTTLVFTADSRYALPSAITVSGVSSYVWTQLTGTLVLTNATGPVSIAISGSLSYSNVILKNKDNISIYPKTRVEQVEGLDIPSLSFTVTPLGVITPNAQQQAIIENSAISNIDITITSQGGTVKFVYRKGLVNSNYIYLVADEFYEDEDEPEFVNSIEGVFVLAYNKSTHSIQFSEAAGSEWEQAISEYVVQNDTTTEVGGNMEVDGNIKIADLDSLQDTDGNPLIPQPENSDLGKFLKVGTTGIMWSNVSGGGSYTAGTGIDITNDTIKVVGSEYKDNGVAQTNALKFYKCTQAQYNALETKDANTLYMIVG